MYVVLIGHSGYMPDSIIECDTLAQARQIAKEECVALADIHEAKIDRVNRLSDIKASELRTYGTPILYAYIDNDYLRTYVEIAYSPNS